MSGNFGGGGSGGQITIGIFLDDSNFNSKISGVNSKLTTLGSSANTTTGSISSVGDAASTATNKVSDLGSPLKTIGDNAANAGGPLNNLGGYLNTAGINAGTANGNLVGTSKNIGTLGRGASVAARGVGGFVKVFGQLTGIDVSGITTAMNVVSAIPGNIGKVSSGISRVGGVITTQFGKITGLITGVGSAALGLVGQGGKGPLTQMSGALANIGSNGPGAATAMGKFKGAFSGIAFGPIGLAITGISIALLAIKENAFGITDRLNEIGKALGDWGGPVVKDGLNLIKSVFSTLLGMEGGLDIGTAWSNFVNSITSNVNTLWKGFSDTITTFQTAMTTLFDIVTPPWLDQIIAWITPGVATAAANLGAGIKTIADNAIAFFKTVAIPQPLIDFFNWVTGGGKTPAITPTAAIDPKTRKPVETKKPAATTPVIKAQTAAEALALQKALANLATQGSNSMSILARNIGVHTRSINTYLNRTVLIASQNAQKALANLANQGSNSMNLLLKSMTGSVKLMYGLLQKVLPVGAQKAQTALANLSNQGIKSVAALANGMSKAMNSIVHSVQSAQRAIISLIHTIGNLHSKTITIRTVTKSIAAAHGFSGLVTHPTTFTVAEHSPEFVNVTSEHDTNKILNSKGGRNQPILIHLHNYTNVDGNELINSSNLKKTIKMTVGENIDKFL